MPVVLMKRKQMCIHVYCQQCKSAGWKHGKEKKGAETAGSMLNKNIKT